MYAGELTSGSDPVDIWYWECNFDYNDPEKSLTSPGCGKKVILLSIVHNIFFQADAKLPIIFYFIMTMFAKLNKFCDL